MLKSHKCFPRLLAYVRGFGYPTHGTPGLYASLVCGLCFDEWCFYALLVGIVSSICIGVCISTSIRERFVCPPFSSQMVRVLERSLETILTGFELVSVYAVKRHRIVSKRLLRRKRVRVPGRGFMALDGRTGLATIMIIITIINMLLEQAFELA